MVVNCPRFLCRHHSPIVLAALALLHLSNLAADAAPDASKARRASASPIYSLSNKQQAIGALGAYGIPAYAMIGRQRCRGTYLSLVRNGTAAYTTGLRSEDVLLSINDRVTESPSVTDKII